MTPDLYELLTPLSVQERERIPACIEHLFHNEDFHLLFRWMNQNCGGIASTSFQTLGEPEKAAWKDGHKAIPRDIFARFLELVGPEREKPKTQETNP